MKVLLLSTYPYEMARHGGQIRLASLVSHYRHSGMDVEVAGVLGSEGYAKSQGFVPYPGIHVLAEVIDNPFLMEDFALGQLFAKVDKYFNHLAASIKQLPDIIQVEHPWLFGFARRYAKECGAVNVRIVYSSHNVEYQLKEKILRGHLSPTEAGLYAQQVKQIEMAAVTEADGVICVSAHDQQWARQYAQIEPVLAANGVAPWEVTEQSIDAANKISACSKFALFCASAHPPNMEGFFSVFGGGFGSLADGQRLIVAGSAGPSVMDDARIHRSARLADAVTAAGVVATECLVGLLETAHCIVLPITQGGGTNLKTAEALWAGRHIVATRTAMRGFEQFIGKAGVQVADSPSEFKQKLRIVMQSPPLKISSGERKERETVLWSHTLQPLRQFLIQLHCHEKSQ